MCECKDLFESCRVASQTWDDNDQDWLEEREAEFKCWAHGLRADKTDNFPNLVGGISKSLDACMRSAKYHVQTA